MKNFHCMPTNTPSTKKYMMVQQVREEVKEPEQPLQAE